MEIGTELKQRGEERRAFVIDGYRSFIVDWVSLQLCFGILPWKQTDNLLENNLKWTVRRSMCVFALTVIRYNDLWFPRDAWQFV